MFWAVIIGVVSGFLALVGVQLWFGKDSDVGLSRAGMCIAFIFGSVFVGVIGWYKLSYSSSENVARREAEALERKCADASMAYVMSQNFLKRQLKSPSSAEFPLGVSQFSVAIGDCRFAINSYVDSQNSFGATLRTRYSATMEYLPKEDKWRAVALDLH